MITNINTNRNLTHYSFPSIGQWNNLIYNVNQESKKSGLLLKPTLSFLGTCKLHGTNASVVIDFFNNIVYYQSRENVITSEVDNAGFARFMEEIQPQFIKHVYDVLGIRDFDKDIWRDQVLVIYGEWCGGSIQKGVALNQLSKRFVVFSASNRLRNNKDSDGNTLMSNMIDWIPMNLINKIKLPHLSIFNIYDYKVWHIDVDFNKVNSITNQIIDMTMEVEEHCPFSAEFGIDGIGEGIVFTCVTTGWTNSDFWFKSKGEKHASKSKVKTIKSVDDEKINKLSELADRITPAWRLEQMFNETFDCLNGGLPTRDKISLFFKSVINDIIKEEMLTLNENGVSLKEITPSVINICKEFFFQNENFGQNV